MNDYAARKYTTEQKERIKRDRTIKEQDKQHQDDLDIIATLTNENLQLGKRLKDYEERYNKECYNVVVNNGYVTDIIILPAYRSYLPLQEINGYDLNKVIQFMQTPLYSKIPFVYVEDRQLRINEIEYNKFIGGLI